LKLGAFYKVQALLIMAISIPFLFELTPGLEAFILVFAAINYCHGLEPSLNNDEQKIISISGILATLSLFMMGVLFTSALTTYVFESALDFELILTVFTLNLVIILVDTIIHIIRDTKVEEIYLRDETEIPHELAKKVVANYIKDHPKCLTSDIIFGLKLDPEYVISILGELTKEGLVHQVDLNKKEAMARWSK